MTMRGGVSDEDAAVSRLPERELVLVLAPSLGDDRAQACVSRTLALLRLSREALTRKDGLAVLEVLARQPGAIGESARLAKSRVYIKWSIPPRREA